jgi:hypothetical protein
MAKICLKVYDLSPVNEKFRALGIGAFHTSITINGCVEYCYGTGEDFNSTGIDSFPIRSNDENIAAFGDQVSLYKVYEFGQVRFSTRDCENIISDMSIKDRWKNGSYSTLMNNCNSFTYEFCKKVLDQEQFATYPIWIFRGQNIVKFVIKISMSPILVLFGKQYPLFRPPLDDPDANYSQEQFDIESDLIRRTANVN